MGSLGNFTECSEVIKKMLQKLQGEKTDCQILPDWRVIKPGAQYQGWHLLGLSTEDDPQKPVKGLIWKMVNTWPKKVSCYPLSKIGVFGFLLSWFFLFFWKNSKEIKKGRFLVNSDCFCFAFHANLISDGKKKRLTCLFTAPLILLINMSSSLFRWTV